DRQTLRQFRVQHGDALDELLARGLAVLVEDGMIDLVLASPAAQRAQGLTGASLVRRNRRLKALEVAAAAHVRALRAALDRDDPVGDERHNQAVRWRNSQRQDARVNAALTQMKELLRTSPKNSRR